MLYAGEENGKEVYSWHTNIQFMTTSNTEFFGITTSIEELLNSFKNYCLQLTEDEQLQFLFRN